MAEAWTVVRGKRARRAHQRSGAAAASPPSSSDAALDVEGVQAKDDAPNTGASGGKLRARTEAEVQRAAAARLQAAAAYVARSPFFGALRAALRGKMVLRCGDDGDKEEEEEEDGQRLAVQELVVYGVGSVSTSEPALYQLALAELLAALLPLRGNPWLYDPCLTDSERALVESRGFRLIAHNEMAKRRVCLPTMLYMPHCEVLLYDNVLSANWSAEGLPRVVVLGNSFTRYLDEKGLLGNAANMLQRERSMRHIRASRECGALQETPVPDHKFRVVSAFNDLALMTFASPSSPLPFVS